MIKKLLTLLFIGVLSVGVFAGTINPYIEVESVGVPFAPNCTIGAETSDTIGVSNWTFTADGSLYDEELLTLQSPVQFDFGVGLGWENAIELLDGGNVAYGLTFLLDETLIFKTGAKLLVEEFEPSFGIEAFFGVIKGWVELAFPYNPTPLVRPFTDWGFVPTVGFSIGK